MTRTVTLVRPGAPTPIRARPVAGDLLWDGRRWRRRTGRRWAAAAYSLHPEHLRSPLRPDERPEIGPDARLRVLRQASEHQVVTNAATVIHDGPTGIVLSYRRPVAHLVHGLLTAVTAGLWAIVWLIAVLDRREDRVLLEADAWGHVWPTRLPGR